MNKIFILIILGFAVPGFLTIFGQSSELNIPNATNGNSASNIFEKTISDYASGLRFKDVLPVAIGILGFSYFIWKTSSILSKRDIFSKKLRYNASGTAQTLIKTRIFYVVKYIVIFPMMMYGWVVVCFFFMYALNTSLSYDILTVIMIGIITATRISAYWNEKLAEDIMKFLPFNLLFTLLLNPNLNFDVIVNSIPGFLPIMLELTIFIAFIMVLEIILKITYFIISKTRHRSNDDNLPIKTT